MPCRDRRQLHQHFRRQGKIQPDTNQRWARHIYRWLVPVAAGPLLLAAASKVIMLLCPNPLAL